MKRKVIVAGPAGVGKTTVLNEFRKIVEQENLPLRLVNYGTMMLNTAKDVVKDRDSLRKASSELQHKLQKKAAEAIVANKIDGLLLIDTHLIIRTQSGFMPGIPSPVLSTISPELIAIIEAPADEILSRRMSDASRKRDEILAQEVDKEIQLSRAMASACSIISGIPVGIIHNPAGGQHQAALKLFEMIKA
ncbi:MAG: adenylate kinase [Candidatus Bathyarchaeota archaeon]